MAEIEQIIAEETEHVNGILEMIVDCTKSEFENGIESVDTKEAGEVVDMIKDLAEAKKDIVKARYYIEVLKAMSNYDIGGDNVNFAENRLYYTEPKDVREGRSGKKRKTYMESKTIHNGSNENDYLVNMEMLEEYMESLDQDVAELIPEMSVNEKEMVRNKLVKIANKVV